MVQEVYTVYTSIFQYHGMGIRSWSSCCGNHLGELGQCLWKVPKKTRAKICWHVATKVVAWISALDILRVILSQVTFTMYFHFHRIYRLGITVWSQLWLIGLGSTRRNATSWNEHWASWKQNLEPTVTRMRVSMGMTCECVSFGFIIWYKIMKIEITFTML